MYCIYIRMYTYLYAQNTDETSLHDICTVLVSWCGGELWVDQRKKCADICDVAQVTDIRTHTS